MEEDGGSMGMLNSMTSEAWGFFLDGNCGKFEWRWGYLNCCCRTSTHRGCGPRDGAHSSGAEKYAQDRFAQVRLHSSSSPARQPSPLIVWIVDAGLPSSILMLDGGGRTRGWANARARGRLSLAQDARVRRRWCGRRGARREVRRWVGARKVRQNRMEMISLADNDDASSPHVSWSMPSHFHPLKH